MKNLHLNIHNLRLFNWKAILDGSSNTPVKNWRPYQKPRIKLIQYSWKPDNFFPL